LPQELEAGKQLRADPLLGTASSRLDHQAVIAADARGWRGEHELAEQARRLVRPAFDDGMVEVLEQILPMIHRRCL
jgi:hypothetical protein